MFHNTIVPQSVEAVAQWDVYRLLHRRSWVRNQVGMDEYTLIISHLERLVLSRESNSSSQNEILYRHSQFLFKE